MQAQLVLATNDLHHKPFLKHVRDRLLFPRASLESLQFSYLNYVVRLVLKNEQDRVFQLGHKW